MPDKYISHILGKISEEEYNSLDKSFEELIKVFGHEREKPAILFIERQLGGKTAKGEGIFNTLINFGFKRGIAMRVMALFSANKMVNEVLSYRKRNIEYLAYKATYLQRLHYAGVMQLTIFTSYARTDEIFIRPIKVPEEIPPGLCSAFEYTDDFYNRKYGYIDPYKSLNQRDVLTKLIADEEYDGALIRVRAKVNEILNVFFGKNMDVENNPDKSLPSTTSKCPEYRRYELELIDHDYLEGDTQYKLIYYKGIIQDSTGDLPKDKVVKVLREEGKWEA